MNDNIIIKGAKEHNLKNIDLTIPRNKLVVVTGLSGSGKSSLAFDTLYAEGQRRYVESLSSYARLRTLVLQLERLQKFTIICVYYMQELECHIVQTVVRKLKSRLLTRLLIIFWSLKKEQDFKF